MQQILFHIPFTAGLFPPDGVPLYGFGAMLFLLFVIKAMIWGPKRVVKVGMPGERLQDMAIVLFVTGIAGARIVYMIQYSEQYKGKNLFLEFFQIWNGGIVFYGSVIGGVIGFYFFNRFILKKLNISTWKLGDALAPLLAGGLAIGRIGCYLNGCCWGQVAIPEAQAMPLFAKCGQFPLLTCHARDQVLNPALVLSGEKTPLGKEPPKADAMPQLRGVQTPFGFRIDEEQRITTIGAIEPGSAAKWAGLQPGDRIVAFNGQVNDIDEPGGYDQFWKAVNGPDWPRQKQSLDLVVERGENRIRISFTPRTVTFFPTQLYETISMGLLVLFLLAFQPFRRHDGQMLVVLMVCYGIHRFFNEAIRIEPTYAMGLTLSQWISVLIITAAVGLEIFLRKTQPRLPRGLNPLGYGVVPAASPAKSAS